MSRSFRFRCCWSRRSQGALLFYLTIRCPEACWSYNRVLHGKLEFGNNINRKLQFSYCNIGTSLDSLHLGIYRCPVFVEDLEMTPIRGPDRGGSAGSGGGSGRVSGANGQTSRALPSSTSYIHPGSSVLSTHASQPATLMSTPPQPGRSQCNTLTRVSIWKHTEEYKRIPKLPLTMMLDTLERWTC